MIGLGDTEQVGDDEHGERTGVVVNELTLALGEELVDLTIGEAPHELLVFLEALRRDQPHQQRSVHGVVRWIEVRELVVKRELVPVLLDERAYVVAHERHREPRERAGHRVGRRERVGVVQHGHHFFVTRDHDHALMRFGAHRALVAQVLQVGVRVGDARLVLEEVDGVEVAHNTAPLILCSMISS